MQFAKVYTLMPDPVNQSVVSILIKELQTYNLSFQACQIRGNLLELSLLLSHFPGAAKTYYKTLSQGESLERCSKADTCKKARRQKGKLL